MITHFAHQNLLGLVTDVLMHWNRVAWLLLGLLLASIGADCGGGLACAYARRRNQPLWTDEFYIMELAAIIIGGMAGATSALALLLLWQGIQGRV